VPLIHAATVLESTVVRRIRREARVESAELALREDCGSKQSHADQRGEELGVTQHAHGRHGPNSNVQTTAAGVVAKLGRTQKIECAAVFPYKGSL
jgi:hypothetical protein